MPDLLTLGDRRCSRCGEVRSRTEFHKDSSQADGLYPACKLCRSSTVVRVARRAERQRWYARHKDTHRATCSTWERKNGPRRAATRSAANAVRPEVLRTRSMRARAKRYDAPGAGVTIDQTADVLYGTAGLCSYCGQPAGRLTVDHVEPLENGGAHEPENLAAACKACNTSKGTRTLITWLAIRARRVA